MSRYDNELRCGNIVYPGLTSRELIVVGAYIYIYYEPKCIIT